MRRRCLADLTAGPQQSLDGRQQKGTRPRAGTCKAALATACSPCSKRRPSAHCGRRGRHKWCTGRLASYALHDPPEALGVDERLASVLVAVLVYAGRGKEHHGELNTSGQRLADDEVKPRIARHTHQLESVAHERFLAGLAGASATTTGAGSTGV